MSRTNTLLLACLGTAGAVPEERELRDCGYTVISASGVQDAEDLFPKHPEIDLAVVCIGFGSDAEAVTLSRRILRYREVPIIFLVGARGLEASAEIEQIPSYGFVLQGAGAAVLDASVKTAYRLFGVYSNSTAQRMEMEAAYEELQAAHEELISTTAELEEKERSLVREKKFIEAILESLPGYLYVYDDQGKLIRWNKKHETMTGFSGEELSAMSLDKWFEGEDLARVLAAATDVFKTGYGEVEADLLIKGGRKMPVRSNGVLMELDGKSYFTGVGIDLTEERRITAEKEKLTEQLSFTQKMDAIGKLAGGIAHDFNNTLTGILGAAELLLDERITTEKRTSYVSMILSAAARAASLTGRLLAFSRKGGGEFGPVNVAEILRDTVSILKRTIDRKITVADRIVCSDSSVFGDNALLQNVFMNMGINAAHAMPDGGTLTFSLSNAELPAGESMIEAYGLAPGPFLKIDVVDTGCGMEREVLDHIFEPFFTTKGPGKGTGLGLSVAYGTIREHHGAISVESVPGKGTSFHVWLPVSQQAAATRAEEQPLVRGTGLILLIDDDEMIRSIVSYMIEAMGYSVITAEDGKTGTEIFRERHFEIDLVVLDMIMPVMGGAETFDAIRAIDRRAKVILASGYTGSSDISGMKEKGLYGMIAKPFRQAELSRLISEALKAGGIDAAGDM